MTEFVRDLTCQQCGKTFQASRRDAKYCPNGTCRKTASRRKEDIRRMARNAVLEIQRIKALLAKYPELEIVAGVGFSQIEQALSAKCDTRQRHTSLKCVQCLKNEPELHNVRCSFCIEDRERASVR